MCERGWVSGWCVRGIMGVSWGYVWGWRETRVVLGVGRDLRILACCIKVLRYADTVRKGFH